MVDKQKKWEGVPTLRILKCHKCKRSWVYTGKSETYCICSGCRTSVYLANRTVSILWDLSPSAMEGIVANQSHRDDETRREVVKKYGGKAVFFVDLFDRQIKLGIEVYSEDLLNFHTLYLDDVVGLDILGIEESDLIESVWEPSHKLRDSGRYRVSPKVKEILKSIFVD